MHSAGWAFAYALWTRHRIVMVAILAYLLVLVLVVNTLPAGTYNRRIIPPLTIPLWFALVFLLVMFCQEDKPDVLSQKSGYPRRLFSVPLSSAALVGWPFAVGAVTLILFWLALTGLILRPAGIPAPLLWPTVFLVAMLAWLQALSWCHFTVPLLRNLLRVTVAMLMLIALFIVGVAGFLAAQQAVRSQFQTFDDNVGEVKEPPGLSLYLAGVSIPIACLVSIAGVARVRRGDVPVWHLRAMLSGGTAPVKVQKPYSSAAQAMFRFQWARHGTILPLMVSPAVVLAVAIILVMSHNAPRFAQRDDLVRFLSESLTNLVGIVACLTAYTTLMAHTAGALLGSGRPWSRKVRGMQPFLTARPVTTGALVRVKIRVAAFSVMWTWALIFLGFYCACLPLLSNVIRAQQVDWRLVSEFVRIDMVTSIVILLLFLIGGPWLTWKEYVSQLWVGMLGPTMSSLPLHVAPLLGIVALPVLIGLAPWAVHLALALKLTAGALIVRELRRRGLVEERTLLRLGMAWIVAAAVIYAVTFWLTPADVVSPWTVANAEILLLLPLVRVGLAPLVMDENRHQ